MIRYVQAQVVLDEIPDKITFAFSVSNCQNKCKGCHSPYLRNDVGMLLTQDSIKHFDITIRNCNCVLFLGEGNDICALKDINTFVRNEYGIETALYTGREYVEDWFYNEFDYIKTGPYIKDRGSLKNPRTNQRLYYHRNDITSMFWEGLNT